MIDSVGTEVEPDIRTDIGGGPSNPDEEMGSVGDTHRFYCTQSGCRGSALVSIDHDLFERTGDEACPECGSDSLDEPANGIPLVAYQRGGGE